MGVCAGAAVSAAVGDASAAALPVPPAPEADGVPFSLTVMLWTVYRNLPFAQRLEKVFFLSVEDQHCQRCFIHVELVDQPLVRRAGLARHGGARPELAR